MANRNAKKKQDRARGQRNKKTGRPAAEERAGREADARADEPRRDEVGRTGVYPASGPLPPGDAEARGMAGWGQGERGAAGYEDSGRSEIWFTEEELEEMRDEGEADEEEAPDEAPASREPGRDRRG